MSNQNKDMIWAALLHFDMNMWCDQPVKAYKDYTQEELGAAQTVAIDILQQVEEMEVNA